MKFLKSFAASLFVLASLTQAKVTPDTSGLCLTLSPKKGLRCGVAGTLGSPGTHPQHFPAYGSGECAQRCYSDSPPCRSFSFTPSSNGDNPGSCVLYDKTLSGMKFKRSSSSSTLYYNSACYTSQPTDDTPLQDGSFDAPASSSNGGNKYWFASGSDTTVHAAASSSNYVAELGASGSNAGGIQQSFAVCPGLVYELTYATGGSLPAGSYLDVEVNENPPTRVPGKGKGRAQPLAEGAPFYFVAETDGIGVSFYAYAGGKKGEKAEAEVDDVVVRAVFRGSLPKGTEVVPIGDGGPPPPPPPAPAPVV